MLSLNNSRTNTETHSVKVTGAADFERENTPKLTDIILDWYRG
jgi:hypothetical protein